MSGPADFGGVTLEGDMAKRLLATQPGQFAPAVLGGPVRLCRDCAHAEDHGDGRRQRCGLVKARHGKQGRLFGLTARACSQWRPGNGA